MHWLTLLVPWVPSPSVIVITVALGVLYVRGGRHVPLGRQICFWCGLAAMYAALQTRLDYYAEREFFVHRLQHLVLHHLAPFLLALAWPWRELGAGFPQLPRGWGTRRGPKLASALIRLATNPVITGAVFVGLIWLWLIPTVHFYAMLDVRLYRLMNWSMAVDGIVFWSLALDLRPSLPARLTPASRVLMQAAVIPPQIASGALITFTSRNLYPLYDLCGRAFAGISAHQDQVIGGLILWIPSTMMSLVGVLIAMYQWFQFTERQQTSAQPRIGAAPRRAEMSP